MSLTAVIVKGNPARDTPGTYGGIYEDLKEFLEEMNIKVSFDAGEPYTTPKDADIWIGHSRGVDRLRFAPEGTLTIKIGSHDEDALNHPEEITSSDPDDYDDLSNDEKRKHLVLHPSVAEKIREKIKKEFDMDDLIEDDLLRERWLLMAEGYIDRKSWPEDDYRWETYDSRQLAKATGVDRDYIRELAKRGIVKVMTSTPAGKPLYGKEVIPILKELKEMLEIMPFRDEHGGAIDILRNRLEEGSL
jgi:hypothetical protein